jgi:DUF917 family protein
MPARINLKQLRAERAAREVCQMIGGTRYAARGGVGCVYYSAQAREKVKQAIRMARFATLKLIPERSAVGMVLDGSQWGRFRYGAQAVEIREELNKEGQA